ncbi:JmjC domain, hydroxylase-domain-containing protein, partial [Thamnocephalis sphaerospora]
MKTLGAAVAANKRLASQSATDRAPPLDLRTVPTRASLAGSPLERAPRRRMFDLPEAPTYRPTAEEFRDPMRYIARIRPEAEQFGICKIVPPEGWQPSFVLDTETFRFRTRMQELNRMEGSTRANMNYLQQLYRFHRQQGTPVRHVPQLNKRPVDLYRLRKEVLSRGGFDQVCREKQWAAIGRALKVDGKTCTSLSNSLKTFYLKIIAPYERYLAENAGKSGADGRNLLNCTDCGRAAHTACVRPRLPTLPSQLHQHQHRSAASSMAEWYCPECVKRSDGGYGFEEGEDYSLASFQQRADQFKERWFSGRWTSEQAVHGTALLTESDVEKEYWRLVNSPFESVEVEYGADLHSSQHGSGFSRSDRQPDDAYVNDPWNLNQLATHTPSLFKYIRQGISGMMVPWLYVGMCFSTFCWHNEDHYTYSVNYMHWGEAKTWYGIPGMDALKFEAAMRRVIPELFEQQPDLLFHLVTLLSPSQLTDQGVRVYTLDQRPGDFIITFPQSYHSGFNQGFNLAEAVNFATPDWCEYGIECAMRYKTYRKPPVFSHDELMMTVAKHDHSRETAAWLQCALAELRDRELRERQWLRDLAPGLGQVVDARERPEEEKQCCYCHTYAYVSWVRCMCSARTACLDHAREVST